MQWETIGTAAGVVGAIIVLGLVLALSNYFSLWLRGFVTRAEISFFSLIFMSLRKVSPQDVVEAKIMATQAGLTGLSTTDLEAHYLAGGNVRPVVQALIIAQRAKIDLNWTTATAIDLAGRNLLEAVQTSVYPRVIDCPDPKVSGGKSLDGVAGDGIQLKVRARVTVRTNLQQLIGGATEETVVARVGEGIVSAIGATASHKNVLANPTLIAQRVLDRGLDSQTAYEIVSIDIANIEVGKNIGARLQTDQAEADVRVARAKAEERRARAIATEQVMRARTVENQARLVQAEAEIPKAEAAAFLAGNVNRKAGRKKKSLSYLSR